MNTIILIVLALLIAGCSTINLQDPAQRLAIQYATAKFIEKGETQKRAAAIIEEADKAKTFFDVQGVPLSDIKSRIIERVRDRGLSPADTLLATALIDAVEMKIAEDIGRGIIGPDDKIRINWALDLIKKAAAVYL